MPLQKVILRAAPDGLSCRVFIGEIADDQNRNPGGGPEQFIERLDTLTVGKKQVEQDDRYTAGFEPLQAIVEEFNPFDIASASISA